MPAATESPVLPRPYDLPPPTPLFAPDSAPTSAIHRLSSISMATADQTHPHPGVKHPLCELNVIHLPVDVGRLQIVPDPPKKTQSRLSRGGSSLNHSPFILCSECVHAPTLRPPSWWTLTTRVGSVGGTGRDAPWLVWGRGEVLPGSANTPPPHTPPRPSLSTHTPPGMDSTHST
ncbi:hypothetical protein D9C73_028521 [Collichthys lucidus]|uniref:Uncharacterized protein n=1 Tax=Collichthys lucidus TaxID=240159 RepID=A0A4U5TUD9_COLLU|nr:hypothetical protein D9C73_028521 [Collichthys lucidus]